MDGIRSESPQIRKGEEMKEGTFNTDETEVFFKIMPDKTLKFRGKKYLGRKQYKERITALVCSNLSGTEKDKSETGISPLQV